ncbi:hypothetical protein [Streptomyces sp. NPDC050528]|uniref:hypothetical protein n=1 Tax=unclassified Streptomyces TaxID=2593676 RepID=UPI0037B8F968
MASTGRTHGFESLEEMRLLVAPDFLRAPEVGPIKEEDALKFAAAREVAAACGWRYSVVAGRRPYVWSALDQLSSRRRPARDRSACGQA